MDKPTDFPLAELNALRAAIAAGMEARGRYVALALTATSALGAFALGKDGNREVLLILPLVLSGFALEALRHNLNVETIGLYLRSELWPSMQRTWRITQPDTGELPSWEEWIRENRRRTTRFSPVGLLGVLPPALVFGAPSVAALALTLGMKHRSAADVVVWWIDVGVLAVSVLYTAWAAVRGPSWRA